MKTQEKEIPKEVRMPSPQTHVQGADHWTPAVLLERAVHLRAVAESCDGAASETLKEYPRHAAMLSFRGCDGIAELHENFADVFYVLEGEATLVTGGTVVEAKRIAPGEVRGSHVEGGRRQSLQAGDVAHIPACVPHQMLVAAGQTVTSLVFKIQQTL